MKCGGATPTLSVYEQEVLGFTVTVKLSVCHHNLKLKNKTPATLCGAQRWFGGLALLPHSKEVLGLPPTIWAFRVMFVGSL